MATLFELKRWFTVAQAAAHLADITQTDVSEADVLRLGLDGELTLSVIFVNGALASRFELIKDASSIEYFEVHSLLDEGRTVRIPQGGQLIHTHDGLIYQERDGVFRLSDDDPYDLLMMGGERCDIEEKYWQLMGAHREQRTCLDGTFVQAGEHILQLQDILRRSPGKPVTHYPIGCLPEDAIIVVKKCSLATLLRSMELGELEVIDAVTADETTHGHRVIWRVILAEKFDQINAAHDGRANVTQVLRWLRKNGGARIKSDGGPDELVWVDENGKTQVVPKKTISTAISLIKSRKKLPT